MKIRMLIAVISLFAGISAGCHHPSPQPNHVVADTEANSEEQVKSSLTEIAKHKDILTQYQYGNAFQLMSDGQYLCMQDRCSCAGKTVSMGTGCYPAPPLYRLLKQDFKEYEE